jgi:regulator of sigma E protease
MLLILAPILVFGLVIFVHELGHFFAAKAVGVYAPRFSIGFRSRDLPDSAAVRPVRSRVDSLGGYVRMASRHDARLRFSREDPRKRAPREDTEAGTTRRR